MITERLSASDDDSSTSDNGASAPGVFELRRYTLPPNNREALYARFRTSTDKIFGRLGFHVIGYWTVSAGEGEGDLLYLLRWTSTDARDIAWRLFADDAEWRETRERTNAEAGVMVFATHSTLLTALDFSPLR